MSEIPTESKEKIEDKEIKNKAIKAIIENYIQSEKTLVNQLFFKTPHGTTIGNFREEIWKGMFEQIIPKKFVIEQSVFIIDSGGNISKEVDLAIFDETYTPYIFKYGKLKFIPIEAVAVVIECKSSSLKKKNLENWIKGIESLKTSQRSYVRMFNGVNIGSEHAPEKPRTQTSTRPIRILCCLNNQCKKYCKNSFDIVIRANEKKECLNIEIDKSKGNLYYWYESLNHSEGLAEIDKKIYNIDKIQNVELEKYEVKYEDKSRKQTKLVSLLTFNLQLNQILMMINNPILFPHIAYAEMFNKFEEGINVEKNE